MKLNKLITIAVLSGIFATGCASKPTMSWSDVIIAEPLPVDYKQEIQLARINEILSSGNIPPAQSAQWLFQRGVTYDNIGLHMLARLDFNHALKIKPDYAEAYNYIGVYLTLAANFDSAYEMFDAASELNPDYDFVYLSRGIALYYGDRARLAAIDIEHYRALQPADPYRIVWQYIIDAKVDPTQALISLKENATQLKQGEWANLIIDLYLGKVSESAFIASFNENVPSHRQFAERLCEGYFYLAKYHQLKGHRGIANNFYALAIASNVFDFIEFKYARLELELANEALLADDKAG